MGAKVSLFQLEVNTEEALHAQRHKASKSLTRSLQVVSAIGAAVIAEGPPSGS